MTGRSRLLYVDWLRGVAVLCMIVWHAVDAWIVPSDRHGPVFAAVAFFGGWAAPLFLFLAGVSVALAGQASLPGSNRRAVGWRLQKRGWQIFGLAHVFRVQSFLLNPKALWSSVFKPDILNILGLGIVVAAFCWSRATTSVRRIIWLLAPAAVVVLLTPASRRWLWPLLLRPYAPRLEAYVRPVPAIGVFSAFPWLAYVLAGAFIGSVIAGSSSRGEGSRFQVALAAAGLGIVLAGIVGSMFPSVTGSEFWSTSISIFLWRIGAMTLAMPLAWAWVHWTEGAGEAGVRSAWVRGAKVRPETSAAPVAPSHPAPRTPHQLPASPVIVFGRASLFVYWVHVEIAYGFISYPLHGALPLWWAIAAFLTLTAGMFVAARLWIGRRRPLVPGYLVVEEQGRAVSAQF